MAEVQVERKSAVPWWLWLIGLLLIIALLWFWLGRDYRDRVVGAPTPETAAAPASSVANAPIQALNPAPASAQAMGSAASSAAVTDPGIYAATADKASLAGRDAAFVGVKVVRIVGPKTFTVASGSDELLVMIDQDVSSGVGSQGRIDIGVLVDLKGTFQRLEPGTINDISNRRFRAMTELERETLGKTQVYLHVTEVGRLK
ncbi:hypothetical protein CSZ94_04320 [Janthinobacterium sp. ROICE36]|uniref:hypothetical protein n=1 Tax=Janthinobacterium sp. ROICE36 TaxID=2048670 RepID=UPI000C7F77BD|nr:hypothetical protein [Janthinobacterium sp. ROICE36]PLY45822.1 hypothetical protein CSZ94_04320 [Janthinobacterium sp. ROICE36]